LSLVFVSATIPFSAGDAFRRRCQAAPESDAEFGESNLHHQCGWSEGFAELEGRVELRDD
jgi:hypothetical protein